ncbi:MAG: peptidylprolyl isomerase [Pseudolabrys sp.]
MRQRLAVLACLALAGLVLGGCSKCGWFWEQGPRACQSGGAPR